MSGSEQKRTDRVCDYCGEWIESNEILFEMTITLRAEPVTELEPPPAGNIAQDLRNLIERMETMSTEQIEEAVDQVYESYEFALCRNCRERVHQELKRRRRMMDERG